MFRWKVKSEQQYRNENMFMLFPLLSGRRTGCPKNIVSRVTTAKSQFTSRRGSILVPLFFFYFIFSKTIKIKKVERIYLGSDFRTQQRDDIDSKPPKLVETSLKTFCDVKRNIGFTL